MEHRRIRAYELINRPLNKIGLELTVARKAQGMFHKRIRLLSKIGFTPRTVFDTGAFVGQWTANTATVFPDAKFVLIEPDPLSMQSARQLLTGYTPTPAFVEAAVGAIAGTANLNIWNPEAGQGSSLLGNVAGAPRQTVEVTVTTLDAIAADIGRFPELVKLDLQGFELEALKGAGRVLAEARVVIIEFGCLPAYIDRVSPRELLDYMYDSGFVLYDVFDLIYRPYDGALTGGDFIFVKKDDDLRSYAGYA